MSQRHSKNSPSSLYSPPSPPSWCWPRVNMHENVRFQKFWKIVLRGDQTPIRVNKWARRGHTKNRRKKFIQKARITMHFSESFSPVSCGRSISRLRSLFSDFFIPYRWRPQTHIDDNCLKKVSHLFTKDGAILSISDSQSNIFGAIYKSVANVSFSFHFGFCGGYEQSVTSLG